MLKRVVIVIVLFITFDLVAGGIFIYRHRQALFAFRGLPKMPDSLKTPRVLLGNNLLSKEEIRVSEIGVITDIDPKPESTLVAGRKGAAVLSHTGSVLSRVQFENCRADVVAVSAGYLCRGAWTVPVILFSPEGKTLLSYEGGAGGVDDATIGRFHGADRIIVGFNGTGGVRMLDAAGKEIWQQKDGNVWHVETVKSNETGDTEILHSNARGEITIRDASGNMLEHHPAEVYVAQFSLTAWGNEPSRNKLLLPGEGSIFVVDMKGKTQAKLSAPNSESIQARAKGTPVRLKAGSLSYASILRYEFWEKSVLYVHDSTGQLMYEEVMSQDCGDVRSVPGKKGTEDLLVGCNNNLQKYSAAFPD